MPSRCPVGLPHARAVIASPKPNPAGSPGEGACGLSRVRTGFECLGADSRAFVVAKAGGVIYQRW